MHGCQRFFKNQPLSRAKTKTATDPVSLHEDSFVLERKTTSEKYLLYMLDLLPYL